MKNGRLRDKCFHILHFIMSQSLKVKIIFFVYSLVIILFFVLSFFLLTMMNNASFQQLMEEHATLLNVANLTISSRQQYMIGVADYYALSSDIRDMISASNAGIPITTTPDTSRFSTPSIIILSTVFYNLEGEPIYYTSKDTSRTPVNQGSREAFQKLVSGRAPYVWEYIGSHSSNFMELDFSPKLCLWRAVRDSNDVNMIGAVAVTIDSRSLLGFDANAIELAENLVIIDSVGQEVYNRSNIKLNATDLALLCRNAFEKESGYFTAQLGNGKYWVSYSSLPSTNFVSLFLYPHTSFLIAMDAFYIYILVGLFLYILCLFPSILLASRVITKPLEILTRSIQQFAEGDRNAKVQFKYDDEIGKLGKAFNAMVLDNERLKISEYELRLKNKDAELSLMQAQINPHFLYNMLNAIQWQALKSGNREIADMAYSMAQVFRISLNRGKGIISVAQEKDLVSYYLSLQKYRLGKKISYQLDFEEGTLICQIPKLILQPLAENAIVHGMAKSSSLNLMILIRTFLSEDKKYLHLTIEDNGCGIPPEILQYLPDRVAPAAIEDTSKVRKSSRFAIKNIYDRLKLIYGNDFSFRISTNHGTSIEIILPAQAANERS